MPAGACYGLLGALGFWKGFEDIAEESQTELG